MLIREGARQRQREGGVEIKRRGRGGREREKCRKRQNKRDA